MLWFPPPCFIPCGHLRRDPVWSSRSEPPEDNRFLQKKTLFSLLLKKYSIYPTHTHSYRLSTQTSASGTLEQMTFYTPVTCDRHIPLVPSQTVSTQHKAMRDGGPQSALPAMGQEFSQWQPLLFHSPSSSHNPRVKPWCPPEHTWRPKDRVSLPAPSAVVPWRATPLPWSQTCKPSRTSKKTDQGTAFSSVPRIV